MLCPSGQTTQGSGLLSPRSSEPLPTRPACSIRLESIMQREARALQRDLIFLVFLLASLLPSPLREMNLVTAHLCLPLAGRVLSELSVCSADDWPGAGEARGRQRKMNVCWWNSAPQRLEQMFRADATRPQKEERGFLDAPAGLAVTTEDTFLQAGFHRRGRSLRGLSRGYAGGHKGHPQRSCM